MNGTKMLEKYGSGDNRISDFHPSASIYLLHDILMERFDDGGVPTPDTVDQWTGAVVVLRRLALNMDNGHDGLFNSITLEEKLNALAEEWYRNTEMQEFWKTNEGKRYLRLVVLKVDPRDSTIFDPTTDYGERGYSGNHTPKYSLGEAIERLQAAKEFDFENAFIQNIFYEGRDSGNDVLRKCLGGTLFSDWRQDGPLIRQRYLFARYIRQKKEEEGYQDRDVSPDTFKMWVREWEKGVDLTEALFMDNDKDMVNRWYENTFCMKNSVHDYMQLRYEDETTYDAWRASNIQEIRYGEYSFVSSEESRLPIRITLAKNAIDYYKATYDKMSMLHKVYGELRTR